MIRFEDVSISVGTFSLGNINFTVPTGCYGVLMGKTGSGKTTILESICGLKPVTDGRIWLNGVDATRLKPSQRGIGFVPQDGALFSTMTVRGHLAFALRIRKWRKTAVEERVEGLAERLGISQLLDRTPLGLSGGERQRVALGRAISFHPGILCMDEPLSALDDHTRREMCDLLESVTNEYNMTALHITHRLDEARRLAERGFLLADGAVIETRPSEIEPLFKEEASAGAV